MKAIKKFLITAAVLFATVVISFVAVRVLYPVKYMDEISLYASKYDVDPYLVLGVIKAESNFDPEAVSKKNAVGLMQITTDTAKWIGEKLEIDDVNHEKMTETAQNIEMGCYYLAYLDDMYDGNLNSVLAAYNAGFGNVDKWLQNEEYSSDGINLDKIPYPETERYVDKIKNNYRIYKLTKDIPDMLHRTEKV